MKISPSSPHLNQFQKCFRLRTILFLCKVNVIKLKHLAQFQFCSREGLYVAFRTVFNVYFATRYRAKYIHAEIISLSEWLAGSLIL